jgi:hypothetical protein
MVDFIKAILTGLWDAFAATSVGKAILPILPTIGWWTLGVLGFVAAIFVMLTILDWDEIRKGK